MSTQRQLRRGTQAENDAFTGAIGETVYTTDTKRLVNHDGVTTGGIQVPDSIDIQNGFFVAADAGGTADVITLTLATLGQAPTAYAEYQRFYFKPSANNTTNVTLNVDGLGAKALEKDDGDGTLVALDADDLKTGIPVEVIYDGTQFVAQISAAGGGNTVLLDTQTASASASLDFTGVMDNTIFGSYFIEFENVVQSGFLLMRYSINDGVSFISGANTYESSFNLTAVTGTTDTSWSMTADAIKTSIKISQSGSRITGKVELFGLNSGTNTHRTNYALINTQIDGGGVILGYGRGDASGSFNADIDAIQILPTSGTLTSGTVRLYGVKK